jgi:acyl-CoA thioesterase II
MAGGSVGGMVEPVDPMMNLFELEATNQPTRFVWTPPNHVLTPAHSVQGGAGLGVATAAMESVTGRPTVWVTAQYLSFAQGTAPIDVDVTVEVAGRNTAQARCTLSRGGREILTAHSALGQRDTAIDGVWCAPPVVAPPEDCPRYRFFEAGGGHLGDRVEHRLASGRQLDEIIGGIRGNGSFAVWIRAWTETDHLVTVPELAFIGDFMPLGFADALGEPYAGNSLDNTLRVGQATRTDWVLLSVHVQQVANGFGYGRAELWAQDGTLLGEVSQTSILRRHDKLRARNHTQQLS